MESLFNQLTRDFLSYAETELPKRKARTNSVTYDDPALTVQGSVVEIALRCNFYRRPVLSAVCGLNQTPRLSHCPAMVIIEEFNGIELRQIAAVPLRVPRLAAIVGIQHQSELTDYPTDVRRAEINRV